MIEYFYYIMNKITFLYKRKPYFPGVSSFPSGP